MVTIYPISSYSRAEAQRSGSKQVEWLPQRVSAALQIEIEATDGWMGLTIKDGTAELDRIVVPVNQSVSGEKFQARAQETQWQVRIRVSQKPNVYHRFQVSLLDGGSLGRFISLISPYLPTKLLTGQGEMEQSMPRTAGDSASSSQIVGATKTTTTTAAIPPTTTAVSAATAATSVATTTTTVTKKRGPGKKLERNPSSVAGIKRPRQADGADDRKQTKGKTAEMKGGNIPETTGGSPIVNLPVVSRTGHLPVLSTMTTTLVGPASTAVPGPELPRPVPSGTEGTGGTGRNMTQCRDVPPCCASLAPNGRPAVNTHNLASSIRSASDVPASRLEHDNSEMTGPTSVGFPNLVDLMGLEFGPVRGVDFLCESETEKAESDRLARPVDPDRPSDGCGRLVDWSLSTGGGGGGENDNDDNKDKDGDGLTRDLAPVDPTWPAVEQKVEGLSAMNDAELAELMEQIVCGETFIGLVSRVERMSKQMNQAVG